jgi:hypothetical protein
VGSLPGEMATASDAEFPTEGGGAGGGDGGSGGGVSVAAAPSSTAREKNVGADASMGAGGVSPSSPQAPPEGGLTCLDYAAVYRFLGALLLWPLVASVRGIPEKEW